MTEAEAAGRIAHVRANPGLDLRQHGLPQGCSSATRKFRDGAGTPPRGSGVRSRRRLG